MINWDFFSLRFDEGTSMLISDTNLQVRQITGSRKESAENITSSPPGAIGGFRSTRRQGKCV